MKYAQSYKDWKKKFSKNSVVGRGRRAASIFAIMAIVVPFLFPAGAVAQTVPLETSVNDVVEEVVPNEGDDVVELDETSSTEEEATTDPTEQANEAAQLNVLVDELPEPATIYGYKIVCNSEDDLPNWGAAGMQPGEPATITATTAADFVSASGGDCSMQPNWDFQYGFAEKDNQSGVHKLIGTHVGEADGTSTAGMCPPTFCGNNTYTGTGYANWKNFDSSSSGSGVVPAKAEIYDLEGAPGVWVREVLPSNYIPYSYPPDASPGSEVSAEIYCHNDVQNFDNYDQVQYIALGQEYHCVAFNVLKGPQLKAYKIVCLTEASLPNWGDAGMQPGEPAMITATTANDFLATHQQDCELQEDWSFQYGFAEKDGQSGVNKLPGGHLGAADGTSTLGECPPTFCGNNTQTGTGYADWKNFDTSTSANGAVAASAIINDLDGAPGFWVRENLQEGYVPFTYPPDDAPGSNVSAEIYCHTDIQNFDNYDMVEYPAPGETYYCVAFNALMGGLGEEEPGDDEGSISGYVFNDLDNDGIQDPGEENMNGWKVYIDADDDNDIDPTELDEETNGATNDYVFENLAAGTYTVRVVLKPNYTQTYPLAPDEHVVTLAVNEDKLNVNFGVYFDNPGNGGNGGGGSNNRSSRTGRVQGSTTPDSSTSTTPSDEGKVASATFQVPEGRSLPRTGVQFAWLLIAGLSVGVVAFRKAK